MSREIYCQDALKWLKNKKFECIITSLPDLDELGEEKYTVEEYKEQFSLFSEYVFDAVEDDGYLIFYQTDRKIKGTIDKSFLLSKVAEKKGFKMIWHKMCLKRDIGKINLFRPTFSHVLCYTKKAKPGKAFADVFYCGKMIYENAMGLEALTYILKWLKERKIKQVVDPFCGQGSIVAMANYYGLNSIGVDIDKKQCEKAKKLTITEKDFE